MEVDFRGWRRVIGRALKPFLHPQVEAAGPKFPGIPPQAHPDGIGILREGFFFNDLITFRFEGPHPGEGTSVSLGNLETIFPAPVRFPGLEHQMFRYPVEDVSRQVRLKRSSAAIETT